MQAVGCQDPTVVHRAHLSLLLPQIQGLILASGRAEESRPPSAPMVRLTEQQTCKGCQHDLYTWQSLAPCGKMLLGRKALHKISSILLVRAKCHKSDLVA